MNWWIICESLQSLKTCVLINNNLWGNIVSKLELPIAFDERFKASSELFFISDFNLLSLELDSFAFKVLYWVILY